MQLLIIPLNELLDFGDDSTKSDMQDAVRRYGKHPLQALEPFPVRAVAAIWLSGLVHMRG